MRRKTIREHLKLIGIALFGALIWVVSAFRLWQAITTGQIEAKSRVYDRILSPGRFWFETGMAMVIFALPVIMLAAWAAYKLAGTMGWRQMSYSEKLARPATPIDIAHRRNADNHDLR